MILKTLKYIFKLIIVEKINNYNINDNYYLFFNVLNFLQFNTTKKEKYITKINNLQYRKRTEIRPVK